MMKRTIICVATMLATLSFETFASTPITVVNNPVSEAQKPRKAATDANLFGHVIVAETGEHLPYATIAIKGTTIGCAADGTGHYNINNIQKWRGNYGYRYFIRKRNQ